jgi:hypothetical protein
MSERKYRQRGYQEDTRDREPRPAGPKRPQEGRAPGRSLQDAEGPRTPNLMASREVFRCARCGNLLATPVEIASRCGRCGVDVHSCINCVSFDSTERWECAQSTLPARVSPKDERNPCTLFAPRTTVERQTGTAAASGAADDPGPSSARRAFDDLFK